MPLSLPASEQCELSSGGTRNNEMPFYFVFMSCEFSAILLERASAAGCCRLAE